MSNKTCGQCRYFELDDISACCEAVKIICNDNAPACKDFEPKPKPTKGDEIRQMSNEEIMFALFRICKCDECPADTGKCRHMKNAQCLDSLAEYLNAPAESEGER